MGDLDVAITSLIYPEQPAVAIPVFQYSDVEVDIPLNGQRTAKVTMSVYDEIFDMGWSDPSMPFNYPWPFGTCLQVSYRGAPVFWGPIVNASFRGNDGVIEFNAVDPTLRLQSEYHPLVFGDEALDDRNARIIPPDYRGVRMLVNAARLNTDQIDANWPDIGIAEGTTNTEVSDESQWLGFQRGDGVLDSVQAVRHQGGFDIDFTPTFSSPDSHYCTMNVYDRLIPNPTNTVHFHYGFGADNLDNFEQDWGGVLYTHAVMLARDGRHRSDVKFREYSAQFYGVYEHWDATDYKAGSAGLNKAADRLVKKYGETLTTTRITPKANCGIYPFEHFAPGDFIFAEAKVGVSHFLMNQALNGRVMGVTLRQADQSGNTAYDVNLEPENVDDATIGTE